MDDQQSIIDPEKTVFDRKIMKSGVIMTSSEQESVCDRLREFWSFLRRAVSSGDRRYEAHVQTCVKVAGEARAPPEVQRFRLSN